MNETELLDLAEQISDGADVAWSELESRTAHDSSGRIVRGLRLVDLILRTHDSQDVSPGEDSRLTRTVASPTSPEHIEPSRRWGHLELIRCLGMGSFGEVWEAFDPTLDARVALKLLHRRRTDDREIRHFVEEARMLARVKNPNVAVVHGAAIHESRAGLWMELVEGNTLAGLLENHGCFGAQEAGLIAIHVCRALSAMHSSGLIHRDVKAQNVMREEGGRILLMDFGGAFDRESLEAAKQTSTPGTPLYMAPELFAGESASVASDVYSVGVLLYYLVTGAFPVEARSVSDIAEIHASGRARLLRDERSDLPESFVRVVERAIQADPKGRFPSAGAMELALADSIGPSTVKHTAGRSSAARRTLTGLLLLVAAAVFLLWIALRPETSSVGPLSIDASFVRVDADGRRTALVSGDLLRVGDGLTFELESARPVHLYVVNEDDQGRSYVLFPLASSGVGNPLEAGQRHTLPGRSHWAVSSTGGRERLLVVASVEPLPEFETALAQLPVPERNAQAVPPRSAVGSPRLRGIGGLHEPSDAADSARPLWILAERLRTDADGADVWVKTFTFQNPVSEIDGD